MLFKKKSKPGEINISQEGAERIMHINYEDFPHIPSIEDDPMAMARVIESLTQSPGITRIIFHQKKKFEYPENQTRALEEVAAIYNHFIKQKRLLSRAALESFGPLEDTDLKLNNLQYIILNLLKTDPIGAYVESKRFLREEKINIEKLDENYGLKVQAYVSILTELIQLLTSTKLIKIVESEIMGYEIGSREIYRNIFRPNITPDFMYTKYVTTPPLDGEQIDSYRIRKKTTVQIYNTKETIKPLYHLIPPEYQISEEKQELVDLARKVMAEHQPKSEEFTDPERMRENFFNIGRDLISELADHQGIELSYPDLNDLAEILVRYTVGFGMIESLLDDPNVQDISINSPPGVVPIFVVHALYGECVTNIVPSVEDVESWASKLRLISARPLDEANPILDTELDLVNVRARVAVITKPLSPAGLAFSIRRHRDKPWTLPLFMKNKMISGLAAGLLSFLIDGSRTMLIAGTRGSGKTSVLGSVLVEIMRKHRIILVEDTLELPVNALRNQGFNIQSMKVRSALTTSGSEVSADEGIRTSLRLGDSALIVGEIRSKEALALYEAMRVGALANVVAGTIHGDSPYGVFDRVVNDLNVPRTSFKATDIIVIANPVKTADGLHSVRRVTQITEVRKHWEDDPLRERGFVDLMKYDAETDSLQPTDALINGDSEILKSIGGQVKEWAGSWDAIWENIVLRAKVKETMVKYAEEKEIPDLLESESEIFLNDEFHKAISKIKEKKGFIDPDMVFFEWEESLKKYLKLRFKK